MQAMGSSLNARIVAEATGIRGGTSSLDRLLHQSPAAVAEAMPASSYRRPGPSVMYSSPLDDARALLSEERSRPYSPSARFASGGSGSGSFAAAAQAQRSLMGGASRVRERLQHIAQTTFESEAERVAEERARVVERTKRMLAEQDEAERLVAQRSAMRKAFRAMLVVWQDESELSFRFAAVVIGRAKRALQMIRAGIARAKIVNQMRRKALFAMLHLCTRRAMNAWQHACFEAHERRVFLRRAVVSMLLSQLRRGLNAWKEARSMWAESRRKLGVAAREWGGGKLRACWSSWLELAIDRQRLRSAVVSFRAPHVLRAFRSWTSLVADAARRARLLGHGASALRHLSLRRGLNTWIEMRVLLAVAKRRLGSAGREWRGGKVRACWFTWVEAAEERRRLINAVAGFVSPALFHALRSWMGQAQVARYAQGLMRRAAHGLGHPGLVRALRAWVDASASAKRLRRRMHTAASALMHRGRVRALRTWRSTTLCVSGLRQFGLAMMHRRTRRGLNGWKQSTAEAVTRLRLLRVSFSSMRLSGQRKALNGWMAMAAVRGRSRRRLKAAAMEWGGGRRRAAWASWLELMYERGLMARASSGFAHPGKRRALLAWAAAASSDANATRIAKSAARAFRHTNLIRGYNTWKALSSGRRRALTNLKRAVSAFRHAKTRRCLNSWSEVSTGRRAALLNLHRAVNAFRFGKLRRGLNSWMGTAAEAARRKERLGQAFRSMRATGLRVGLNTWVESVTLMTLGRRRLRMAASEWRGGKLRACWFTWMEAAEERRKLRHAASGMRAPGLHRAWASWCEAAEVSKHVSERMSAVIIRLWQTQTSRALNSWRALLQPLRALKRFAASIVHRRSRLALNAWSSGAAAFVQLHARMRRVACAVRLSSQRKALNGWMAMAAVRGRSRRRLKAAAMEWGGGRRRAAWASWLDLVHRRRMMSRAASGFRAPGMRRALVSWIGMATSAANRRRVLWAAAASFYAMEIRRGFNSWAWAHEQAAEGRRRLRMAASEWRGGKLRACWFTWMEAAEERRKLRHAASGMRAPGLHRAWASWCGMANERRRTEIRMRRALQGFRSPDLARALRAWMSRAEEQLWMAYRMRGVAASLQYLSARRCLNSWVSTVLESRRLRGVASAAAASLASGGARRALSTWIDRHVEARQRRRHQNLLYNQAARALLSTSLGGCFHLWKSHSRGGFKKRQLRTLRLSFERMSGREALRSALNGWQRIAAWDRRHAAVSAYRQVERDLIRARRLNGELEHEVGELRRDLAIRTDEHAWRASFEAENKSLRSALDTSQKETLALERKYAELEEKYKRLYRATHDPNYVQLVQTEEQVVYKVPASKHVVEKLERASHESRRLTGGGEPPPQRMAEAHPGWPVPATWSRGMGSGRRDASPRRDTSPRASGHHAHLPGLDDGGSSTNGITRLSASLGASGSARACANVTHPADRARASVTDISTFASRQHSAAAISNAPGSAARSTLRRSPSAPGRPPNEAAASFPGHPTARSAGTPSAARDPMRSHSSDWTPPAPRGGRERESAQPQSSSHLGSGADWLKSSFDAQPAPHE